MKIRYTFRIEDFEDLCVTAERLTPHVRRIKFAAVMAGWLLSVAPFLAAPGLWPPDKFLLGMEPMALCLVACGLQNVRRTRQKFYAAAVTDKDYEADISEGGVMTMCRVGRSELKWEALPESYRRRRRNSPGLSYAAMYVFPKRAFTAEQLDEFKKLIASHVPVRDGKTRTIRLL